MMYVATLTAIIVVDIMTGEAHDNLKNVGRHQSAYTVHVSKLMIHVLTYAIHAMNDTRRMHVTRVPRRSSTRKSEIEAQLVFKEISRRGSGTRLQTFSVV